METWPELGVAGVVGSYGHRLSQLLAAGTRTETGGGEPHPLLGNPNLSSNIAWVRKGGSRPNGGLSRRLPKQCMLALTHQRGCNKSRLSLHGPWGALGDGLPRQTQRQDVPGMLSAEGLTGCNLDSTWINWFLKM